jgi:hypothetical protein
MQLPQRGGAGEPRGGSMGDCRRADGRWRGGDVDQGMIDFG